MIESSDDEAADHQQGEDVVGTAYHESLTSVDGFTRGPKGQVKFNKDTKKRRREADERDQDIEMADPEAAQARPPKNKKKADVRPGQEFKAKVGILHPFSTTSHSGIIHRKLGVTSRKTGWILMPISVCPRPQRKVSAAEPALVSLESEQNDSPPWSILLEISCTSTYTCCINHTTFDHEVPQRAPASNYLALATLRFPCRRPIF